MSSELAVVVVEALLVAEYAYAAIDPGNLCKEEKAKGVGKRASGLLRAFGKSTEKSTP